MEQTPCQVCENPENINKHEGKQEIRDKPNRPAKWAKGRLATKRTAPVRHFVRRGIKRRLTAWEQRSARVQFCEMSR